jgi:peptidoglycan lytic transglycosylase
MIVTAALVPNPAGADGIDRLRSRAQEIADAVSELEHRLASLQAELDGLQEAITSADREIARLELQRHESEVAYQRAVDDYVRRAVEVYKSSSPGMSVELLLSARDLNELVAFAHLTNSSAEAARESLATLHNALATTKNLQSRIDQRKQKLLVQAAAVEAVTADINQTLAARRDAYDELNKRIKELEAEARLEARRLAASSELSVSGAPSPQGLISNGIPPGFATTGVSFEGIASWYGPGFEGESTANGDIFDPDKLTAASRDLPLGSWLYVEHEGRGVVVYINDRGPYLEGRVLDLSQAAAEAIGISGLGWVTAEVLIKL